LFLLAQTHKTLQLKKKNLSAPQAIYYYDRLL